MGNPEKSWFRRTPPELPEIQDVWHDLFERVRDEVIHWTEPNSRVIRFLGKRSCEDMHVCITTKTEMLESTRDTHEELLKGEMPSFTDKTEEKDDENEEEEPQEEQGGIAIIDNNPAITDSSELLLHMEIRHMRLDVHSAGISLRRFESLGIQPNMALKAVRKLSKKYRRIFADIMLYQLANIIYEDEMDEETDSWADLPTVIDMHLDMPNIRQFHKELAGR